MATAQGGAEHEGGLAGSPREHRRLQATIHQAPQKECLQKGANGRRVTERRNGLSSETQAVECSEGRFRSKRVRKPTANCSRLSAFLQVFTTALEERASIRHFGRMRGRQPRRRHRGRASSRSPLPGTAERTGWGRRDRARWGAVRRRQESDPFAARSYLSGGPRTGDGDGPIDIVSRQGLCKGEPLPRGLWLKAT